MSTQGEFNKVATNQTLIKLKAIRLNVQDSTPSSFYSFHNIRNLWINAFQSERINSAPEVTTMYRPKYF